MDDVRPRRLGYVVPKPGGTLDSMVLQHTLDQQLTDEFNTTLQVVFDLQPILQAFQIADMAFVSLETALSEMKTRGQEFETGPWIDMAFAYESQVKAQHLVMAFLSSARSFRDHALTALARKFGKGSPERAAFETETHRLYDMHFSYRFLSQLRHMSQHVTLPISTLRINADQVDQTSGLVLDIKLALKRDELLTGWTEWKPIVRADIERQPEEFDLLPLLKEEIGWLAQLCGLAVRQRITDLLNVGRYLDVITQKIRPPEGAIPVLWIGESLENLPPSNFAILPFEEVRRLLIFLHRRT